MRAKNETYYHIQRLGANRTEWYVGDSIKISGSNLNAFYTGLLRDIGDFKFIQDKKVGLIEYNLLQFEQDKNHTENDKDSDYNKLYNKYLSRSTRFEKIAKNLNSSLIKYLSWIREEIFEQTRIQQNKKLPSRKHCIWLSDKDGLQTWWDMFNNHSDKKILKINLGDNANIFKTFGSLLQADTIGIDEYKALALDYWNGEASSIGEPEFLCEGNIEVVDVFNNIEEIG